MKRISKWFSHTLFLLVMSPSPSLQRQASYRSGWLFQDTAQVCTGLMGLLSVLDLLGLNQTHRNKGLTPHWPPHPPHRPMVTVDIVMTVSKNRVRVVCSPFLFSAVCVCLHGTQLSAALQNIKLFHTWRHSSCFSQTLLKAQSLYSNIYQDKKKKKKKTAKKNFCWMGCAR